jgi:hypothetical protein
VFYDFVIKLKLIINGVTLLLKITFFIKGHFFVTFSPLLETPDSIKSDPLLRHTKNKN